MGRRNRRAVVVTEAHLQLGRQTAGGGADGLADGAEQVVIAAIGLKHGGLII
jgi:hypothetical protein